MCSVAKTYFDFFERLFLFYMILERFDRVIVEYI